MDIVFLAINLQTLDFVYKQRKTVELKWYKIYEARKCMPYACKNFNFAVNELRIDNGGLRWNQLAN